MKKKVHEYEVKLLYSNLGRNYENSSVFEQKVIYDLKNENERLRMMISGKGLEENKNQPNASKASIAIIQKRLIDFNRKL